MQVQDFLNTFGIEKLKEDFHIDAKDYPELGIMVLNYNQIDSPKHNEIVKECRGLILENRPPYNVVARSFDRFFNLGECPKSSEWEKERIKRAVVFEKIDGSLINIHYHDCKWRCSTRKMAEAEGENRMGTPFVEKVESLVDLQSFDKFDRELCFICELVSPESRVVKPYTEDDIYLLSVRNKCTGYECTLEQLQWYSEQCNIKLPKTYTFANFTEIRESMKDLHAMDEGYVAVDFTDHSRIKIKNPAYLAIAHLRDNGVLSLKRIAILVMSQEHEEYLQYFEDDRRFFTQYINAYEKFYQAVHDTWNQVNDITDQKEFALKIKNHSFSGIMFSMRKGLTFAQCIEKMTDDMKLRMLEGFFQGD